MNSDNKIEIKNRMIKKAASLWGVSPNEIESSFDPLVLLLISACASEISKISGEINNSHARITERLIQLMTPETSYGTQPAHAVAHAMPTSNSTSIFPKNLLYYTKKIKNQVGDQDTKTIYFSPLQKFKLVKAKVSRVLCDTALLHVGDKSKLVEEGTLSVKSKPEVLPSTFYLGIETDTGNEQVNLKDVSFFFELLDVNNKELFYDQLQQAKFYYNDKLIKVSTGFDTDSNTEKQHLESLFSSKPNKTRNIEYQVGRNYKKHYITIMSNVF